MPAAARVSDPARENGENEKGGMSNGWKGGGKSLHAHMCRRSIIDANLRRLHGGFESALHQLARLVVGQILAHDYLHHDADELAQT